MRGADARLGGLHVVVVQHALVGHGRGLPTVVVGFLIVVAEIQQGSVLDYEDPNYALICRATETIEGFLNTTLSDGLDQTYSQTNQVGAPPPVRKSYCG